MTEGTGQAAGEQKELTAEEKGKLAADTALVAANARKIDLENEKARAELDEWTRRASERAAEGKAKEKELRLKNEELRLKNEGLERTAITDMVPNLLDVKRGATTVPADSTVFDALLGGRAVQDAADKVVEALRAHVTPPGTQPPDPPGRIVVTTDLELAARDARYLSVVNQLDRVVADIAAILRARPQAAGEGKRGAFGPLGLPAVAVGLAKALPGLLSLLSPNRTLTTSTSTLDGDIAMMAVAGALAGAGFATVVVEKARILTGTGAVGTAWEKLEQGIQDLDTAITEEEAALDAAPEDADTEGIVAWLEAAKPVLTSAKATAGALVALPEGGGLSVLSHATLQEALHDPNLAGVLVLKAGAASATQLVDDRVLRADPISVVSTATIGYLLISPTAESRVLVGGLAHGVSQFAGTVGSRLVLPEDGESGESTEGRSHEELRRQNPVRGSAS